jgi:hypothetical protein
MVINGPTPIMFDMFKAVAWSSPKRRSRGRPSVSLSVDAGLMWVDMKDGAHHIQNQSCVKRFLLRAIRFIRSSFLIGVGRDDWFRSPSLRTGHAGLPHPALQLVVHLREA